MYSMSAEIEGVRQAAAQILLFQDVLVHPIGQAWITLVDRLCHQTPAATVLTAYGAFFSLLAEARLSWPHFLIQQIHWSTNPFAKAVTQTSTEALPLALIQAAQHDLRCFQRLAGSEASLRLPLQKLGVQIWWSDETTRLTGWNPLSTQDWAATLEDLADHYRHQGVGICARYQAFRWYQHQLLGVAHPDWVLLDQIYGYERQKQQLCHNTEALLARTPALHVLLYGARGTGKSSMVKAMLSKYCQQGLRLLELNRAQLIDLPIIVDNLRQRAQCFILFVDDLSFEADETDFKQLKVLLEGDISAQPTNVRLYATTNRRHLIREFFQDRPNPSDTEIHAWDTVQEKLSLRDRFGLTLTFAPFTQADYLATVDHLMHLKPHIDLDPQVIRRQAIMWAQQQNGFSGRTARQFVDSLDSASLEAVLPSS